MPPETPKSKEPRKRKGRKTSSNLAVYVILGVGVAYLILRAILYLKAGE